MTKVYTKTGDSGETVLYGGERVAKTHPRLVAYGTIDELNSAIGWFRALGLDRDVDDQLITSQNRLFEIGAELATPDKAKLEGRSGAVQDEDVALMEQAIDGWEDELEPIKNFILPGGTEGAARAHVVRTLARRAERCIVALKDDYEVSPVTLKYMNRLSDMAFVMARVINHRAGTKDIEWKKR